MIDKVTSFFRTFEEELPLVQLLGPLFLICTLTIAARVGGVFHYDLLAIGAIGLFLCAKWHVRGCVYALILLGVSSLITHLFVFEHQALQFGLEGSVAFALIISGLSFEEGKQFSHSLHQKIGAKEQTIQNLEEEMGRHQEQSAQELMTASNKITFLSQVIEEMQSDTSSLQVLNEVLRKTAAKTTEEKELLADKAAHSEQKIGQMLIEIDALQKEIARIGNDSILAQQNKELFAEINEVRFREAQTHQINETLARLRAKESQKTEELNSQIHQVIAEKEKAIDQLSYVQREAAMSNARIEQLTRQLEALQQTNQELEKIQSERSLFKERVVQAEAELLLKKEKIERLEAEYQELKNQPAPQVQVVVDSTEKEHLVKQIAELRSHLAQHAQSEALYRQLRAQFEEKNQVLHQTRAQLFHSDTQLQTIKQELEHRSLEVDPLAVQIREELSKLEETLRDLDEENNHLHDLVTHLMDKPNDTSLLSAITPPVKKK